MHCKGVHFKDINIFATSINLTVIPIINILQSNFLRLCRFNFTVNFLYAEFPAQVPKSRHRYRKVGTGRNQLLKKYRDKIIK